MLPNENFFADVERVLAEVTDVAPARLQALADELERLAGRFPRVADRCYAYQARLYAKMHDYERAKAAVDRALVLLPLDQTLQMLRGDLYREAREYTQAISVYAGMVQSTPEAVTAQMNLAEVQKARGNPEQALQNINEALKHEPRSLRLIYRRALILVDLRRVSEAVADLQLVARLTPDDALRGKAEQRLRELGAH